jgi:hypothetical protein
LLAIRLDFLASKSLVIFFDNYFAVCATDLSCLVSLPTEDDGLYHITADASFTLKNGTKIVYLYGDQSIIFTESSAANINTNDNQSFLNVITSNVEIVAAAVVAAVVSLSSSLSSLPLLPLLLPATTTAATTAAATISTFEVITLRKL